MTEGPADCDSQGDVTGWKDIGMSAAEHEVDLRCPWADASMRGEYTDHIVRLTACEGVEFELAGNNRLRDPAQRPGLCPREPEATDRRFVERKIIQSRRLAGRPDKSSPYRVGTGPRHHLRNDDLREAREPRLHEAQWQAIDGAPKRAETGIDAT